MKRRSSIFDITINFSIALGIAITAPLFIYLLGFKGVVMLPIFYPVIVCSKRLNSLELIGSAALIPITLSLLTGTPSNSTYPLIYSLTVELIVLASLLSLIVRNLSFSLLQMIILIGSATVLASVSSIPIILLFNSENFMDFFSSYYTASTPGVLICTILGVVVAKAKFK